jgi:ferredoxin
MCFHHTAIYEKINRLHCYNEMPGNSAVASAAGSRYKHRNQGESMPKITVEETGTFDVSNDKRLVNALLDEAKLDQLHACGGNARCTTCRVQFIAGEPDSMTQAEKDVLTARGLITQPGLRLSCQILCDHDMSVRIISRLAGSGRADAGKRPADEITPPPVWTTK